MGFPLQSINIANRHMPGTPTAVTISTVAALNQLFQPGKNDKSGRRENNDFHSNPLKATSQLVRVERYRYDCPLGEASIHAIHPCSLDPVYVSAGAHFQPEKTSQGIESRMRLEPLSREQERREQNGSNQQLASNWTGTSFPANIRLTRPESSNSPSELCCVKLENKLKKRDDEWRDAI